MKNHKILLLLSAFLILLWSACGNAEMQTAAEETFASNRGQGEVVDESSVKNIFRVAQGSPDHTTLVAAVEAADLIGVLSNTGPITVFAPTNAAFEKLPPGTVEDLLKPENKAKLASIITSHASAGKYLEKYFKDGMQLSQATGHKVGVEIRDGDIYVNGSKLLGSVNASNGIVYVVDDVFLLE